jgi:hypothetical protein
MSLTKLSLAGDNLIFPPREKLASDIQAGDGKIPNLFLQCIQTFVAIIYSVLTQTTSKWETNILLNDHHH